MLIINVYACAIGDDISNESDLGLMHVKKLVVTFVNSLNVVIESNLFYGF